MNKGVVDKFYDTLIDGVVECLETGDEHRLILNTDARLIAAAPELLEACKLSQELLYTLAPALKIMDAELGDKLMQVVGILGDVRRKAEGGK